MGRGGSRASRAAAPVAALLMVVAGQARADDDRPPTLSGKPQLQSAEANAKRAIGADEAGGPTILEGVPAFNGLDALRDTLRDQYGIYLHGIYLGIPTANLAGGLRPGQAYSGRLDVEVDVDAGKVAAIQGGTLHANMFQIDGRDLSQISIGNFLSTNDIAALPTTRLYELWYEQKLGDKLALRVGQQGVDVEFLTSNYAGSFVDATFGWPGLPAQDLPDGGPAYPLAAPAARLKFEPVDDLAILAAVFDGAPAGHCKGNPQVCDRSGLNFRISDPPLIFLEAQYRYNQGKDASGLPGTVKFGAFGHFGRFGDQRLGADGRPLAAAASNGIPLRHSPNGGFYGVVDQQIFRPSGAEPEKGIGIFVRAIAAPGDRNPVDLYLDAGFSALGLVPGRPEDLFGVAGAIARMSSAAVAADEDRDAARGIAEPVRDFEAVLEVTYQAQVLPGLTVQPTFQHIVHPGGNIADPHGGGRAPIRDAEVFGVTTTVRF